MGQTTLSESLGAVEAEIAAGRPERALELCQQIATHYPRALAVQRVLGEVYLALRKPREALGALDRALAGNPEDARACCARALIHQIHGNSAGALEFYRRACDINPDDQVLRGAYRELAMALGQPPYQPSRMGLARLYLRGDLLPHAIREWEALLAEQPDSLEADVGLAETLWRAQAFQAAGERCRRILANVPSCVKALLILAAIEHDAGQAAEAQRLVRRVAELDPDQRIAQILFADRLAAGDRNLRLLLFGEERAAGGPALGRAPVPSAPFPTQMAAHTPQWSRPLVDQRAPSPSGSGSQPLAGASPSASMPGPLDTGGPLPSSVSRPSALPADFRSIFAETEYMLWSREETDKREAVTAPRPSPEAPPPSPEPPQVERAGASASLVPPALREQGFNLEETEMRAAINWVHWLQAQGARARDGAPAGAALTGGVPAMPSAPPPRQQQTGPLPPPTPEALRTMFAMLDDDTSSPRVVEGEVVSVTSATSSMTDAEPMGLPPVAPDPIFTTFGPAHDVPDASEMFDTSPRPEDQNAEWISTDSSAQDAPDGHEAGNSFGASAERSIPGEQPGTDAPALTLEALERDFASSGFQTFELKPGGLASLAAQVPDAAAASDGKRNSAAGPAEEAEAGEVTTPQHETLPSLDDYPARLALARTWYTEGRATGALVEYRRILMNAPDLLLQVMDELRERIAEVPDDAETHRLLGDAYIRQGDYLSALEAYNRAVALTEGQQTEGQQSEEQP